MADKGRPLNTLEKQRLKTQSAPESRTSGAEVIELRQSEPKRELVPYVPFDEPHTPTERLRLRFIGGKTRTIPYSQILEHDYDPPSLVSIHTATRLYLIEGRELELLDAKLANEECFVVTAFDLAAHEPPDASGPLITEITVVEAFEEGEDGQDES